MRSSARRSKVDGLVQKECHVGLPEHCGALLNLRLWDAYSSYDFAAVHDGRTINESLPYGLPKGMEGFAFNTRRSIFADI
jgi:hypothetical protein